METGYWEGKYLALKAVFTEFSIMHTRLEKEYKKEKQRVNDYKRLWLKLRKEKRNGFKNI